MTIKIAYYFIKRDFLSKNNQIQNLFTNDTNVNSKLLYIHSDFTLEKV